MSESEQQHPLADRALIQLKKLANGNGLDPQQITLLKSEEQVYVLKAVMNLTPACDVKTTRYPGRVRGSNRQICPTIPAMHAAVQQKQLEFAGNPENWLKNAVAELKTLPGEGWGVNEAKVVLPETSLTLAASEPCAHCHGQGLIPCTACQSQGMIMCSQCQGRGEELCYHCYGRGDDPNHPGQPCHQCQGTRYATCRFCMMKNYPRGLVPCPTCQGRRGVPCLDCRGTGQMTEESAVEIAATARFRLKAAGLPSGLNRMLDRIGLVNLTKGHADIETYVPDEDEEIEIKAKSTVDGAVPALHYRARVPYADVKISIKGQIATISVFGKRGILLNVPPFLDEALMPARGNLARAAVGHAQIEAATDARCVRDALALQLAHKGKAEDLKRLYPVGLSLDAAKEIMVNARRALNRATLRLRVGGAAFFTALAAGGFYGFFFMPVYAQWVAGLSRQMEMLLDITLPCGTMLLSWVALGLIVRVKLGNRFPGLKFALWQKTGKTGFLMLGGILAAYAVMLALVPVKPAWMARFLH